MAKEKKGAKFGRHARNPSSKLQPQRTERNKRLRRERHLKRMGLPKNYAADYTAPGGAHHRVVPCDTKRETEQAILIAAKRAQQSAARDIKSASRGVIRLGFDEKLMAVAAKLFNVNLSDYRKARAYRAQRAA